MGDGLMGLAKLINSRRYQTIADQMVVSGSNFATGIILVRGLGLEQFGVFTVAYALILLANSIQLSYISSPMITLAALSETDTDRMHYLRGMYGIQVRFCLVCTAIAGIVAGYVVWARPKYHGAHVLPSFLLSLSFYLMQDWLRRYYFAAGKSIHSIWNDAISYLGQAVVLIWLWYAHRLTVNSAFWAMALTSAAAFLLGIAVERLGFNADEVREAWKRTRVISRDLAIANQLQWFVYQGAMLVGASVLGAEAAGSVRATQNVVGPVNVAYQAMENLVPLKAGEEMRRGGIHRVEKFLLRFGAKGFVALFVVFFGIALFSRSFLSFFYGRKVAVYTGILDLQMLYFLLLWPLRQYSYLFRTIGKTSAILMSSLIAAIVSLALIYPCVKSLNALGIMVAAVAGQIANLLYLVIAWMRTRNSLMNENNVPVLAES
jgi:O-antigen/teichoic acid export membrane protein